MIVRRLLWIVAVLVVLAVIGLGAIGWYYADQILTPGEGALSEADVVVEQIGDGTVTLTRTPDSQREGVYAATAANGSFVQVGAIVTTDDDSVTRRIDGPSGGELVPGDEVTLEGAFYPADPDAAFDFTLEEVPLSGELGAFPAFVDRQDGDVWAILVHGRGATRREGFRMVRVLHDLGISSIVVSYRNDDGAPASPDGRYGLGATEWRDLVPAARYALDHGARELVMVGFSMGGEIVSQFMHEAPEADQVHAVVLDAPVLDWAPVLYEAADARGLPRFLTDVAMVVIQLRTEISFGALDQIERAREFDVPILVLHGTADSTVPIATSEAFARARPDLVTLVPVEGAEHVQSWNLDPAGYARAVGELLAPVGT